MLSEISISISPEKISRTADFYGQKALTRTPYPGYHRGKHVSEQLKLTFKKFFIRISVFKLVNFLAVTQAENSPFATWKIFKKNFLKNFRYFRKWVCLIFKQFKNFEMSENVKNLKILKITKSRSDWNLNKANVTWLVSFLRRPNPILGRDILPKVQTDSILD